jgi:hypothetical protein
MPINKKQDYLADTKSEFMALANTIDEVILRLDNIIADSTKNNSRAGYFACLYRKMTIAVKQGIAQGYFENAARMEKLDVAFANRYLEAYDLYAQKKIITQSWHFAFEAQKNPMTVIQHLLLGMNAHINLDLGIAAAQISKGSDIHQLQRDFNKINEVIGSLINSVQTDLEDICFPMKFVRFIDNRSKDAVINFSMKIARDTAWANALAISMHPENSWNTYFAGLDKNIAVVAGNITRPKLSESLVLKMVQYFEPKSVGKIIACLKD